MSESLRNHVLMKQQILLQNAQMKELIKNKEHLAQKLLQQEQQEQERFEYTNNENKTLHHNLSETVTELGKKEAELLQCNSSWQEKYTALENKYNQAVNEQGLKTDVTPGHMTASDFEDEKREIVNYYTKCLAEREHSAMQTYEYMRKDIERLCQMLSEANNQLKQTKGEKIALEDKFAQDLAANNQSWESTLQLIETKVEQAEGEKVALEDKFAKELAANDQTWEKLMTNHQQDLFQLEEEVNQKKTEILNLSNEKEGLWQQLQEATDQLTSKGSELLLTEATWQKRFNELKVNEEQQQMESHKLSEANNQLNKAELPHCDSLCHEKYDAQIQLMETKLSQMEAEKKELEDKFAKELAEKDQTWEKLMTNHHQDLFQLQEEVNQKKTEILNLNNEKEGLWQQLQEATDQLTSKGSELLLTEATWQKRFNELKVNEEQQQMESHKLSEANNQLNKAELPHCDSLCHEKYDAQIQLMETKLSQMEAEKKELEDKFAKELAEKDQTWEKLMIKYQQDLFQLEEEVDQKKTEVLNLINEKEGLWQQLQEATDQLTSKGGELLLTEATWQKRFNELKVNEEQQQMESHKLSEANNQLNKAELPHCDSLCHEKYDAQIQLMETKLPQMEAEKKELEDKFAKELAEKDQTWEKLMIKYQQDLFQLEEEVDQKKTEVLNLINEKEGLWQQLQEATDQLTSKGGELLLTEATWQKRFNELKVNEEQQQMESHKLSEANNQLNKAELPHCDSLCHEKYDAQIQLMETKLPQMEAEKKELEDKFAKELAEKDQTWEKLLVKYQQDLFQLEEEVNQKKTEILNLSNEKEGLWQQLQEATDQLTSKGSELLLTEATWQKRFNELKVNEEQQQMESHKLSEANNQLNKAELPHCDSLCHEKYDAQIQLMETKLSQMEAEKKELEDKFAKELAEKDQTWEKLMTNHHQDLFQLQEEVNQKKTEILNLNNEKEGLWQQLQEATDQLTSKGSELLLTEATWQKRFNELKVNEEQQQMESHKQINQLKQEIQDLRMSEILDLSNRNDSLSLTLMETTSQLRSKEVELSQSDRAWQDKYNALEDRMTKALAESDQNLESLKLKKQKSMSMIEELLQCCKDKDTISQKLRETIVELSSRGDELQKRCNALADQLTLMASTKQEEQTEKKEKKKKKGFSRWFHKKKTCADDTRVIEEAACCPA